MQESRRKKVTGKKAKASDLAYDNQGSFLLIEQTK
jgi:hypothetical protein